MFGWNLPCASGEDENETDRCTDDREADNKQSGKFTWAFISGELKSLMYMIGAV